MFGQSTYSYWGGRVMGSNLGLEVCSPAWNFRGFDCSVQTDVQMLPLNRWRPLFLHCFILFIQNHPQGTGRSLVNIHEEIYWLFMISYILWKAICPQMLKYIMMHYTSDTIKELYLLGQGPQKVMLCQQSWMWEVFRRWCLQMGGLLWSCSGIHRGAGLCMYLCLGSGFPRSMSPKKQNDW